MTNIRRYPLQGRPAFLTLVCHQRNPLLASDHNKKRLMDIIRTIRQLHPFRMHAWVILNDHLHLLISIDKATPSTLVQKIKLRFTRQMGGGKFWQRRFWDHICRDDHDVRKHMDYIHYNPVKHGLVISPGQYRWSSFRYYCEKGYYNEDWGWSKPPEIVDDL